MIDYALPALFALLVWWAGTGVVLLLDRLPRASAAVSFTGATALTVGSLVFWSLYQMAPNGLQMYAVGNVWMNVWGVPVAPQWVQNINTVVIVIGGIG